ncbi:MAG TPA: dienelactone hydrolase family protein [Verrucomicrobiae bacterium]|nr:dienelactone hydrolase family protein [Verrucomicrobiae bacterium]
MKSYIARPVGDPKGGVLLFQDAFGVNDWLKSLGERLAKQGYLVVAPELFHRTAGDGFSADYNDFERARPHYGALTVEGLLEDIREAHRVMREAGVADDRISALGFCMGGRVAYLANTILPLKRAISFYGGGIDGLLERVPDLHAPMLFFWAGIDKTITTDLRRKTVDALAASGKTATHVLFSDAEHGFFCEARSMYHPRAAQLAWPLMLEFLN